LFYYFTGIAPFDYYNYYNLSDISNRQKNDLNYYLNLKYSNYLLKYCKPSFLYSLDPTLKYITGTVLYRDDSLPLNEPLDFPFNRNSIVVSDEDFVFLLKHLYPPAYDLYNEAFQTLKTLRKLERESGLTEDQERMKHFAISSLRILKGLVTTSIIQQEEILYLRLLKQQYCDSFIDLKHITINLQDQLKIEVRKTKFLENLMIKR
jgi:hypothetical protein